MRRAVLRDGLYRVPVAADTGLRDGFNLRNELDSLSFDAAPNVHGNFRLYFNGSGRIAGIRERRGIEPTYRTGRRLLLRVAAGICAVELCKGRSSELQTLRAGEYFNRGADNLRGWVDLDDFGFENRFGASVDEAVLPFIPGDIIKAAAAAILGVKLQKVLGGR